MPSRLRLAGLRVRAGGRLHARGRVRVERGVRIAVAQGARVVLDDGCVLERGVRIAVAEGARVVLERGCVLGAGCRIDAGGGCVRVGAGARVGERAILLARAGIDVGARCVVGDWALLADTEPTYEDPEVPTRAQPLLTGPIRLGDGARVGPHAAVLAAVAVPAGAIVGAYEVRTARRRSA